MMTTKEFNDFYWEMFDAGIVEDEGKPDAMQLQIEELDGCRIWSHYFEVSSVSDARQKIEWLLKNTPCYEVVFFNPGSPPVTWRGTIKDNEWNWYYKAQ